VTLNISDESSSDVQKILANVKEARSIESSKYFYIRLEIIDSKESGYIKRYYWGMI
jgi:hypothetical protein